MRSQIDAIKRDLNAVVARVNTLENAAADIDALNKEVNTLKLALAKQNNLAVDCDQRCQIGY